MTTEELILTDLDKDIIIHTDCRYSVKRYAYHKFNYIDNDGKPITEKVYSFILMHGKRWYNDTTLNFKESELGNVLKTYKKLIVQKRSEKRISVLIERAERKLYPKITEIAFSNVVLTAIEEFKYIGKKEVRVYANGMPYRYGTFELNKDEVVDHDFILDCALSKVVAKYNVNPIKPILKKDKKKPSFVPYHFYIGYLIELRGMQLEVRNFRGLFNPVFETNIGSITLEKDDYKNIKVIGELTGINSFSALMNKVKFIE